MSRHVLFGGVFIAALLAAGAAGAFPMTLGSSQAVACYERARDNDSSIDAMRSCNLALTLLGLNPVDRAATLVNRGILYLGRRDNARALTDFDAALRLDANLAEAHTHRGIALFELGDYRGAVEALSTGLSLVPDEPEKANYARAMAYEDMGEVRAAYDDFRRAAELAPRWEPARIQLARFQVRPRS
jgi:tetratricopeptide (TPR) repeat protein